MPYLRIREYLHYFAPISVPFTVDGCTIIYAFVFVTRRKRRVTWVGAPTRVSYSAASNRIKLVFRTPPVHFLIGSFHRVNPDISTRR